MTMSAKGRGLARSSVVLLWLHTGLVSLWELHGQSLALLQTAGLDGPFAQLLILAGAGLDLLLGAALWRWHARPVYRLAGLAMLLMTLTGSLLLPALWLHPLGPLSKNVSIAALLYLLHEDARPS